MSPAVAATGRALVDRVLPPPGPLRPLAVAVLINCLGSGMFVPVSALYYTHVAGLTVGQVALGLGIAAVAGLLTGVPLGHLADRLGPREVQIGLISAMGLCALGYLWLSAFWQFVVLAAATSMLDRGVAAVGGALIAGATKGVERVRARAYLRVTLNTGLVVGSGLAVFALQAGTPAAFRTVIVVNALSYLGAAALYLRVPHVAPTPRHEAVAPWWVLRDARFVGMVALFSVLEMHQSILTLALPLWIAGHTAAPAAMTSVVIVANTLGCVLLQVPVARRAETVPAALRSARLAGLGLLAACVLFALAAGGPVWLAVTLLCLGGLCHLAGELLVSSSQFCLAFQLARDNAQGQYQGLFSTGMVLSSALAPGTMALLPLGLGSAGWLVLGAVFMVVALLLGLVVGARAGQREPEPVEAGV